MDTFTIIENVDTSIIIDDEEEEDSTPRKRQYVGFRGTDGRKSRLLNSLRDKHQSRRNPCILEHCDGDLRAFAVRDRLRQKLALRS